MDYWLSLPIIHLCQVVRLDTTWLPSPQTFVSPGLPLCKDCHGCAGTPGARKQGTAKHFGEEHTTEVTCVESHTIAYLSVCMFRCQNWKYDNAWHTCILLRLYIICSWFRITMASWQISSILGNISQTRQPPEVSKKVSSEGLLPTQVM